ncbi:hypothetical protein ACPZ19_28170 [Amycolatopsis lurida]
MLTRTCPLAELATDVAARRVGSDDDWRALAEPFQHWAARPGLRAELRAHIQSLPPEPASAMIRRSRETTTHFAWCLRDERDEPFSFWLHEYKPQRDWRHGYADSVHNHRYHFWTTILRGSYLHERYTATLDAASGLITSAELIHGDDYPAGTTGVLLADEFHRIPKAADNTMTFLVKSRPVNEWSVSFDPLTRTSHRHVPVETRLGELLERI